LPKPKERTRALAAAWPQVRSVRDALVRRVPRADAPQGDRAQRARRVHRGYYRWLRLSRLALGAFIFIGGVFLAWAVPWLPSGLEADDYTPRLAFTVYLLGGAALTGLLALVLRELALRSRERLMVWSTVYDEETGLHNRAYLFDWLALECDRARRSNGVFTVVVLQIRIGGAGISPGSAEAARSTVPIEGLQRVAQMLDPLLQPAGLIALLSQAELAVVTIGAGRDGRPARVKALRDAVAAELTRLLGGQMPLDVKAGAATYGTDGEDTDSLVQAARAAAVLALPPRVRAA
jgi:GGDEF domain-containing protein